MKNQISFQNPFENVSDGVFLVILPQVATYKILGKQTPFFMKSGSLSANFVAQTFSLPPCSTI